MAGTRWGSAFRSSLGTLHRELRIWTTAVPRPDMWLFVVGCYNSGTELLTRILGTHSKISELPTEGQFLTDQMASDFELGLPRMWVLREDVYRLTEEDDGPDVLRLKKEWAIRSDRSKPILMEKSPPNAARTRWFQRHFENAHFVAIVRNGYAVAEGIRRKAEPRHLIGGWPIELCARQWSRSNEVLAEDAEHLDRVIWTRYEDLTRDPQLEIARILRFLGLQAEDFEVERPWAIHERNEGIRDMNDESIGRLTSSDIRAITEIAGATLQRFGYPLL